MEEKMSVGDGRFAFEHAYLVLVWCRSKNIRAEVRMAVDGSGTLLVYEETLHRADAEVLERMLHSNRWGRDRNTITLTSCEGWHE